MPIDVSMFRYFEENYSIVSAVEMCDGLDKDPVVELAVTQIKMCELAIKARVQQLDSKNKENDA